MTAVARPIRRRSKPLTVAAMLAAAAFVLALTVGAALSGQTGADAPATAKPAGAVAKLPAVSSVKESAPAVIGLSAVPQLPALHGVRVHKARPKKPASRSTPPPVRIAPVAPVVGRPTPAPTPVQPAPVRPAPARPPPVRPPPVRRPPVVPAAPPVTRKPSPPSYVG